MNTYTTEGLDVYNDGQYVGRLYEETLEEFIAGIEALRGLGMYEEYILSVRG